MANTARDRILRRLFKAATQVPNVPPTACLPIATYDRAQRLERLTTLMSTMRTQIEMTNSRDWVNRLQAVLKNRDLKSLLYSPETAMGHDLETAWPAEPQDLPALYPWQDRIEEFKDQLFQINAAITTTRGAIAETGAIVLWPDEKEPRLMSLVPPVHIAVLEADRIYNSFCEIIQAEKWPDHMPTNALLISGPSKTADIEMTLAFGVHGPRELIVLIIDDM
jgi:L-lactate dehydrogenase complex protein LldG